MSKTPRRRSRSSERRPAERTGAEPESTIRLSYAEKVRALLRESLIDAAADALAARSWTETRMADIAAAVGVSRQTVYNEFGNKDELARALLLREASQFLGEVESALDDHPSDAVGALSAAFEVFLRLADEEPLLRAILGGESEHSDLGPLLKTQGAAVLPYITERLSEHFMRQWPQADHVQVLAYADAAVRLAISHVVLPTAQPDVTATQVARVFAPYLAQLTNSSGGRGRH
ncbi:MAG TPA: TetR family transcriptional regulator [Jatrophihabitans sp.]